MAFPQTLPEQSPHSVGITMEFMRSKAPELAKDIVLQLDTAANLAHTYGLDTLQWQTLKAWPAFQDMIRRTVEELAGPIGITEKIRRQARLGLAEFGVADMVTIMGDKKAPAAARARVFETLAEVAGVAGKTGPVGGGPAGGGPLIQINFPDGRQFGIAVDNRTIEGEKSE